MQTIRISGKGGIDLYVQEKTTKAVIITRQSTVNDIIQSVREKVKYLSIR